MAASARRRPTRRAGIPLAGPVRRVLPWLAAAIAVVALMFAVGESGWWFRLFHPLRYRGIVTAHAKNYDLPPDLLAAVIYQESRFDPHARSKAGAIGLMQLTPATAGGIALHTGGTKFHVSDLDDPELNIRYGAFYLHRLHQRLDHGDRTYTASLAAYNAGQGTVAKWLAKDADHHLDTDEIPFPETRAYVEHVQRNRSGYRTAYFR